MTHWSDGPIVAFDVETTGTDVEQDRIVTYCVCLMEGQIGKQIDGVINPGVPIPESATKVHGVTDAKAQLGQYPQDAIARIDFALHAAWQRGWPVVVYNAPFDLTMLDRELRRHLGRPLEIKGPVIDPLVLDKAVDTYRKGSRRLTDTCKHYVVPLTEEDAHTASGDAYAAAQLARVLCQLEGLRDLSLADLYRLQQEWYREQRVSFNAYLQKQGKTPDDDNLVWPLKPWNGGG